MRRTTVLGAGALAVGVLAAAGLAVRRARLEPMLVEGGSMRPTLDPGQRIAVAPLVRPPARCDLVVVARPRPTGDLEMVKRVVGLPWSGRGWPPAGSRSTAPSSPEPYLAGGRGAGELDLELGPAQYLVLGEPPGSQHRRREFGPVGADALLGLVRFAYWPPAPAPSGLTAPRGTIREERCSSWWPAGLAGFLGRAWSTGSRPRATRWW
jgi:hypothetical protein